LLQTKQGTPSTHFKIACSVSTYPLQVLQRTFLLSCNLVVFPLYKSSRDTLLESKHSFYIN
uniref:Uncharacterized protein n=1 Tax=Scleropages formosus TaxID=113540 RepID=A0A8C9S3X5_SCLFO